MNTQKYYYVADCSEQTIKSYTFYEFFDDVVFDFIGRNFDYFEKKIKDYDKDEPENLVTKNALEVLNGESEADNMTKNYLINVAIALKLRTYDSILFSTNFAECINWNKNIKVKALLCD